MALMTSSFDLRSIPGWFRVIGLAEAVSWAGLLVGMYFKYLGTPQTEVGVKVFGPIHGGVFVAFVIAAVLVGFAYKWSPVTWILALLASIVPLGSVIFIMWADRTAKIGAPAVAALGSQPGRPAPEST
jgi:integral membrane protein